MDAPFDVGGFTALGLLLRDADIQPGEFNTACWCLWNRERESSPEGLARLVEAIAKKDHAAVDQVLCSWRIRR